MMKLFKGFVLSSFAVFCIAAAANADEGALIASKNSDKYHLTTCSVVKQIAKENQVTFKIPSEALRAGYKPCQKCNPPTADNSFIGSKNSTVYHTLTCNLAKKITPENAVYFTDKDAAAKAGYKPCQVCLPSAVAPKVGAKASEKTLAKEKASQ